MNNFKDNNFNIFYQDGLKNFVIESLEIAKKYIQFLNDLFECKVEDLGELKVSVFCDRDDFENYIKSVAEGRCPPKWATGCFFNSEIQMMIDKNDENELKNRKYTLLHELVHLYIKKQIYQRYKIKRITWFDESFATYLAKKDIKTKEQFFENYNELKNFEEFDVNIFEDSERLKSDDYNAYHMFSMIGKYIFDNNLEKTIIVKIIKNRDFVIDLGKTILKETLIYFKKLKESYEG